MKARGRKYPPSATVSAGDQTVSTTKRRTIPKSPEVKKKKKYMVELILGVSTLIYNQVFKKKKGKGKKGWESV